MADFASLLAAATRAQIRADLAYALALRGNGLATATAVVVAALPTIVDREVPDIADGPPTTLTIDHEPLNDDCCVVWRGSGDGWAMTTAWVRVGTVFTLTNARGDANELFQISYRY